MANNQGSGGHQGGSTPGTPEHQDKAWEDKRQSGGVPGGDAGKDQQRSTEHGPGGGEASRQTTTQDPQRSAEEGQRGAQGGRASSDMTDEERKQRMDPDSADWEGNDAGKDQDDENR
ncbi:MULTISPECIES: hypothetical protein [Pseudomonas]|uniref:hypothetical protein n=1 Tax=Pseudomonas TaxID=286 RepID=UPI001E53EC72|nr:MULTISPECIES: hypothetical protein [Pseudomonas]MCE1118837.1 hypothetical protein [Pseudomonas sp. NMI795_08]